MIANLHVRVIVLVLVSRNASHFAVVVMQNVHTIVAVLAKAVVQLLVVGVVEDVMEHAVVLVQCRVWVVVQAHACGRVLRAVITTPFGINYEKTRFFQKSQGSNTSNNRNDAVFLYSIKIIC